MGRCESVNASIGIKILLSDLFSQINETNFNLIEEMLNKGCIESTDEILNDNYDAHINNNQSATYLEFMEYISEIKSIFCDEYLLISIKEILSNDRWGYDIYGKNYISRPIDFNLDVNINKYKGIKNIEIVFILEQSSC
jgi:hypothetical protein